MNVQTDLGLDCLHLCYQKHMTQVELTSLQKHAYSNILKILQPKKENFQIKNSDIFHISSQNRLWVLVRPASPRWF